MLSAIFWTDSGVRVRGFFAYGRMLESGTDFVSTFSKGFSPVLKKETETETQNRLSKDGVAGAVTRET
jgi:hypothetical protein